MDPKHIFNADGRWVCFVVREDVFSKDGHWPGTVRQGRGIYGKDGEYLDSQSNDGNRLSEETVSLLQA
jgi:hypothetical protein